MRKKILGHMKSVDVTDRHYDSYDHADEKRDAMNRWEARLLGIVGEGKSIVVQFGTPAKMAASA